MTKRMRDTTDPPATGSPGTAAGRLTALFIREAYIRYRGRPKRLAAPVTQPHQAVNFARSVVHDQAREHALALYLDSRDRPLAYAIVSVGTADSAEIHPREVFQTAIHAGASNVILLHNHPSGDPQPSVADYAVAKRLTEAGRLLRIHVVDSIVWTHHSRDYVSLGALEPKLFTRLSSFKPGSLDL